MVEEFPMHRAAEEKKPDWLRGFIEFGWSVDIRDDRGRTPLHWAARRGRYENAQLLIRSKCSLDLEDSDGCTAVLLAAKREKKAVVDLLLRHRAKTSCPDDIEWTLLHCACELGWADVVHEIVQRGEVDLNAKRGRGKDTALIALAKDHADVVSLLIRAGADVNLKDELNWTALHWAADERPRLLQVLLQAEGLDLNPQNGEGETPLHLACKEQLPEVVRQLLEAGADPNIENIDGNTALNEGIIQVILPLEEIRLFVQHGAFLQDSAYKCRPHHDPEFKNALKDVSLCTQSIVNKFHRQSLPALSSITYFATKLPHVDNFKLSDQQIDEVENLVKGEIERKGFCNVIKAHPMSLSALCVLSLITCQSGTKRSASTDLGDINSPFKKLRT